MALLPGGARARQAQLIVALGLLLCIPGVVMALRFAADLGDKGNLRSAAACLTATRDPASACVSLYAGTATSWNRNGTVEIRLQDGTSTLAGYGCGFSPAHACDGMSFQPNTPLMTAWWRGHLVAFGPAESRPAVVTYAHPDYRLRADGLLLWLVIPGVSALMLGILRWQSPMDVNELLQNDHVDARSVRRVAWGYWTWPAFVAWFAIYVAAVVIILIGRDNYEVLPLILVMSLLVSLAVTGLIAPVRLARRLRSTRYV